MMPGEKFWGYENLNMIVMKDKKMKKILFSIILFLMFVPGAYADTIEFKYSLGAQIPDNYFPQWPHTNTADWYFDTLSLIKGLPITKTIDATAEFTIGRFVFGSEDVYNASIILGYNYDYIKLDAGSLYLTVGVGLGYWTAFPYDELVDRASLPAILQYGTGIKIFLTDKIFFKAGYGFRHDSALFSDGDVGINSHRLEISYGVEW